MAVVMHAFLVARRVSGGMFPFLLLALLPLRAAPPALLLDAALAGAEAIAVGERGTILRSSDHAATWHAVPAPTRATLTAIAFAPSRAATPRVGWAVGHDALILATTDSGRTWTKQFQGQNLEDSFLDVIALDDQHAIAVGAYGLFVATHDGGKTWIPRKLSDEDYHFNRIAAGPTGTLYLAGERGTLLRSTDRGAQWSPIHTGYEGSFYGILPLDARTLLAYGLRGHVFRSTDDGETWTAIPTPAPAFLATAATRSENQILLAGQSRALFVSRDGGVSFTAAPAPPATAISELLPLPNGTLLAVGEAGTTQLEVGRVTPNAPPQEVRTP